MYGLKNVRKRRHDALSQIDDKQFEVLMAEHYVGLGWEVEHVGTGSGRSRFDGGIDLKLRRDGQYVLVQCKHWNAKQVTHNAVHELLGIKINEGATGAIVITSGEFTNAAKKAAARQGHVELIDGNTLRAMLGPLVLRGPPLDPFTATRPTERARKRHAAAIRGQDQRVLVELITEGMKRGKRDLIIEPLVRLAVGAVGLIVLVQCGPTYLKSLFPAPPQPAPRVQSVELPQAPPPFRESIERERQAQGVETPPKIDRSMEDAALQEWRRRNAQSMKILEETTPEL